MKSFYDLKSNQKLPLHADQAKTFIVSLLDLRNRQYTLPADNQRRDNYLDFISSLEWEDLSK